MRLEADGVVDYVAIELLSKVAIESVIPGQLCDSLQQILLAFIIAYRTLLLNF